MATAGQNDCQSSLSSLPEAAGAGAVADTVDLPGAGRLMDAALGAAAGAGRGETLAAAGFMLDLRLEPVDAAEAP